MPVLEVDGKPLAQSYAINRFLARKYGLAGKDDWEASQLDSIADFKTDFQIEIRPYLIVAVGMAQGDKEKLFNEVFKPAFEKFAPVLLKLLQESGSGFYGKNGVSWVDFELAGLTLTMSGMHPELLEKYPELVKHMEKVHALPQLKNYIETRPKTPF
uniref:glutathione transferase n=1 Tax=Acrobeloides nanus TaxID=290746 RepID=A0A914EEU7_9BILA